MSARQHGSPAASLLVMADGVALAAQMLMDIESSDDSEFDRFTIEGEYREPGKPQVNIVQEYIDRIRAAGNREVEEGFTKVLTDFLACADGGPAGTLYLRLIESEALL